MKRSKYNFFFQFGNGKVLAYNALRNGLAVIDQQIQKRIEQLQPGHELLDMDHNLRAEIERGGFVIQDSYDEFGVLRIRRHMQQFGGKPLGLTIAPTINCNLSCKYCFENPDKHVMTPEIQNQIVKFIRGYAENGTQQISVTWYGGEPLLCMNQIEKLSTKIMNLCEEFNVGYSADIITNGTLLTKQTAEQLKILKVHFAQVTLDGDRTTHDIRRPFRGGNGSFDTIISRLRDCAGSLPISLRINVDQHNVTKALSFYKWLLNQNWFDKSTMSAYFGYVRKYSSSCRCSQNECLLPNDFWEKDFELQEFIVRDGITGPNYPDSSSGCGATSTNSYVIGPKGELYKCWNHVGNPTQIVGTVDAPIELTPLYIDYLTESFENDQECRECKFLPICMGGCVDVRIKQSRGEMPHKDCSRWKFYLESQLKLYYEHMLQSTSENTRQKQEA